ncbi:MAG: GNAT family N-acetyltransferase [Kosmotoga sp.]|nr:MAG: GNAT family N-acetyltransferase [Kosmotoga sp.]
MERKCRKLSEFSQVEVVELLNDVFKDYVLPLSWNLDSYKKDIEENCISETDSLVCIVDGENAGIALLAFRESRCRIYLMGVKKKFRRAGIGFQLMDDIYEVCKWKGVKSISLEVPAKDERAVKFYSKYGFREKRQLFSLYKRLKGIESNNNISLIEKNIGELVSIALELQNRFNRKPNWKSEPKHFTLLKSYESSVIRKDSEKIGYLIWGEKDKVVYLIDMGPYRKHDYSELMRNVLSYFSDFESILFPSIPEGDPIYNASCELSFEIALLQYEMTYKIH